MTEPTRKQIQQARAFLFKNGERPRRGVTVKTFVESFARLAVELGISYTELLIQIRAGKEQAKQE